MPDYSKGVIYTIRCRYDTSLIYVGSTIQPLAVRWGGHKRMCYNPICHGYNYILYQKIRETCWDDWYIELYEEYLCENVQQLRKREGEVIREIGTLNMIVAGRTRKEYREDNKEKIIEQKKQYYEDNKEDINKKHKQYNKENKEDINQKRSVKIQCECGCFVNKRNIARHCKSLKHLAWEATQGAATN